MSFVGTGDEPGQSIANNPESIQGRPTNYGLGDIITFLLFNNDLLLIIEVLHGSTLAQGNERKGSKNEHMTSA
jgi:hypothetical protein